MYNFGDELKAKSLKELEELRDKIREDLSKVEHQIRTAKKAKRTHY